MILPNYVQFRAHFANVPTLANDGHPIWPPAAPDSRFSPITTYDFTLITPKVIEVPGTPGDEFHWYICEPGEGKPSARHQLTSLTGIEFTSTQVRWGLTSAGTTEWTALVTRFDEEIQTILDDDTLDNKAKSKAIAAKGAPLARVWNIFLRDVHIYAKDVGDQLIYHADLHRCAFSLLT